MKTFLISLLIMTCLTGELTEPEEVLLEVVPEKLEIGDVGLVKVKVTEDIESLRGEVFGKEIHFFLEGDGYFGLIGAGLYTEPKEYFLDLEFLERSGKIRRFREKILVVEKFFETERLYLPKEMVTLSKRNLKRVREENGILNKIWETETKERLWKGNFILPVEGEFGSRFGLRRIINGKRRSPHTGVDIKAKEGSSVLASNSGRVIFIDNLFFSGNSIILDHGFGLYTMYFHLSDILVKEGDIVSKGEVIGRVGQTGRASGPHLHFGVRLQGKRVDPLSLLSLSLTEF
ncbi:MAG: M23 family metallopeptidase [bacterium]|nr:M23 family metallopeptidase [bacterium]